MSQKTRLDQWLVAHGLCDSRTRAQRFIQAGQVYVNGQQVDKPATKVPADAEVEVKALPRFVSRGGEKLEAALVQFDLDPGDKVCLDVGASTGGFTDCLLQHAAARVYAVDVGKHQLDARLRQDPRVVVLEEVNARHLTAEHVPEPVALASVDVAFISLLKVLPAVVPLLAAKADLVTLVKPQFEAGKDKVGRGGVVRDPTIHEAVLTNVVEALRREHGLALHHATFSPLRGPAGNIEFLCHFRQAEPNHAIDLAALVADAHATLTPSPT